MYQLIRQSDIRKHWLPEAGSLTLALLIAELSFKFHSFTLECLSFLATWYALSWLAAVVQRQFAPADKIKS